MMRSSTASGKTSPSRGALPSPRTRSSTSEPSSSSPRAWPRICATATGPCTGSGGVPWSHAITRCQWTRPTGVLGQGVGLAAADLFSVPLSRRMGLTIQPRRRFDRFTADTDSIPDFAVDGTTSTANSINQQTVREARRYVYLHPQEALDERVQLPEPTTTSRMSASNIDGRISEEGMYPEGSGASWPRLPRASGDADDAKEGISLADLPWPI